ncbi:MAG: ABC transporter substrate-binding protein [Pirellulaceae bacterium]
MPPQSSVTTRPWFCLAWAACLIAVGCQPSGTPQPSTQGETPDVQPPLRVLVIEDPEMARALDRQWTAVGGGPLQIRQVGRDEFLSQEQRRLASDIVVFPSPLLGELAGRDWLQPLDEQQLSDPRWQRQDVWPLTRLQETRWGRSTVAVPLGSPTFVLMYRTDVFAKLGLKPPVSWTEYAETAQRLSEPSVREHWAGEAGAEWSGICEPLASGWAAEWLLARAAPYARHHSQFSTLFDISNMRPLIDGPPFVRALDELVACAKLGAASGELDPGAVRQRFLSGRCALAVSWLTTPAGAGSAAQPAVQHLAFAPLPGAVEAYNFRTEAWEPRLNDASPRVPVIGATGRLAAVTRECRNPAAALVLVSFMSAPESSAQVAATSHHTTMFRDSHVAMPGTWVQPLGDTDAVRAYAETLQTLYAEPTCLITLRIPGRWRYLQALDEAVRTCIRSDTEPRTALAEVAAAWNQITEELGRDAQRKAYVASIGLE